MLEKDVEAYKKADKHKKGDLATELAKVKKQRDEATARLTSMLEKNEVFASTMSVDMKRVQDERDAAVEENKRRARGDNMVKEILQENKALTAENTRLKKDKGTVVLNSDDDDSGNGSQGTVLSEADKDCHKENEILRKDNDTLRAVNEKQKNAISIANSTVEVLTRLKQGTVVRDPTVKNKDCDELFAQKVDKEGGAYLLYIETVKTKLEEGNGTERATVEEVLEILKDNDKSRATETLMKKFKAAGEEGTVVTASQNDDWGMMPKDFKFANTTVRLGEDDEEDEDYDDEGKDAVIDVGKIDPLLFATIVNKLDNDADEINDKSLKNLGYNSDDIEEALESATDFLNAKDGEVKKKKVSAVCV